MLLRAIHTTTYTYSDPASLCHTEVRLKPRAERGQLLLQHHLSFQPEPSSVVSRYDFFGNEVTMLTIDEPHTIFRISATSLIDRQGVEAIHPALTPPWEEVRDAVRDCRVDWAFAAYPFTLDSPRVPLAKVFGTYAESSFPPNRPLLEGALDLCRRIFTDFRYDVDATSVTTSVEQALRSRVGVCQDFAHVMIACLRVLGLPARYVSGYLRTGDGAVGAHASHAWLAVYCPGFDWLDLDPTNNMMPSMDHVTLGWGRDYSDIPPVKGVALGGGEQSMAVEVRVVPPSPVPANEPGANGG
jgi:transglutaminase-like putative cysteine protease